MKIFQLLNPLGLALLMGIFWCQGSFAQTGGEDELSYRDQVQIMYVAYYGRPGDAGGLDFWAGKLEEVNGNLMEIIDSFGTSMEFQDRFGDLDDEELVDNIFLQLLGRRADSGGLNFYVNALREGRFTLASLALNVADGTQDLDELIKTNKLRAANAFSEALVEADAPYGEFQIDDAKLWLGEVDSTEASVTAALDRLPDLLEMFSGGTTQEPVENLPPTWVFAGDVPNAQRTALREEMEYVRTWFADQYGVVATGFTVLVGADSEALTPVFRDVVGPGPIPYSPLGILVMAANNGSAVIVINLGSEGLASYGGQAFSVVKGSIVHEYFHVLQGQLASGFAQLPDGKIAYELGKGPFWLVEGLAEYADYAYSQSRLGRRPYFERKTPYGDLENLRLDGSLNPGDDLMKLEDAGNFQGDFRHPIYNYAMAFAAATLLVEQAGEDSYVQYWKLLHDRSTWQQAFEESFGIGIEGFYEAFEEWLPSKLPSYAQLSVYLRWPGKEALSSDARNRFLYDLNVAPDLTGPSPPKMSWGGGSSDGAHTITSTGGFRWTGYLSLSLSSDACTEHLLGWYKDGELTDQRTGATLVEFTGSSSSLEWTLPTSPDMLPRLSEKSRCQRPLDRGFRYPAQRHLLPEPVRAR